MAAKWGRNNMVILLLDKRASIVAKTRDGLTPLHCAARSGHAEVVDTLLQRHAPITAKTKVNIKIFSFIFVWIITKFQFNYKILCIYVENSSIK